MTGDAPFDRTAAEQMLGPRATAAAKQAAADAPPLTVEQREQLRAVFASARTSQEARAAANAAQNRAA